MREIEAAHPEAERIELWYQDEARVGQKGRLSRRWYQRGMRPRGLRDHRFGSAYIFGATCPERDTGVAIVITRASAKAMNLLLAELALALPPGTHAVLLMDNAGWHIATELVVPSTITLVPLPPYSPELNAIERVWLYLRDRFFSNVIFQDVDAVIDACCNAWNALLADRGRIRSLCSLPWAEAVKT